MRHPIRTIHVGLAGLLLAALGCTSTPHWGYEGAAGPDHWADLSPEWSAARDGRRQSPIDLGPGGEPGAPAPVFDYQAATLNVVNNGHTIQCDHAPGSRLTLDDGTYELRQFHFHTPSEHTFSGAHRPMEMHLVHQSEAGALAVVAVTFEEGAANAFLDRFWDRVPRSAGGRVEDAGVRLDVTEALPADRSCFHYSGSLTTPPCSEGVRWVVFEHPVNASADQVARFTGIIGENDRPVQPLHGRRLRRTP